MLMSHENKNWFQRMQETFKDLVTATPVELEPLQAYQLWANTYDKTEGNALLFAESSAVRPLLEALSLQGKVVLDAGCGTGRYLEILRQFQPHMLVGIDFASNMIERASKKNNHVFSTYLQVARLDQLPFRSETFDFVVCTLALDNVLNLESTVEELARVLRRNGSMVISSFHPYGQLLSWTRSFRVKNSLRRRRWFAVKYYQHLHSEYFRAFQISQLELEKMIEPVIDETLKSFYTQAGRVDLYERFKGYPLLLIFQVRKG